MKRGALPLAGAGILGLMLAGAYAMEAYVPAGTPRIVTAWGTTRDGRPMDRVEIVGIPPAALRGLPDEPPSHTAQAWAAVLRVLVDDGSSASSNQHVIGRYSALKDRLRFEPRFPFVPGVAYRVEVDTGRLARMHRSDWGAPGTPLTHRFSLPAPTTARSTRIVAVHPATDRVPSNMLRWYVEFSAPMEPGSAHKHVRLIDEAGRAVERAFLQVEEELWDGGDRRRLTLLFDPGRVKRGVRANVEMGAPLIEGRRYRLEIDPAWLDARGAALASGFEKEFDVGPADRESPDPIRWTIAAPNAGTRDPLRITFGEALDHALIARMLSVERDGGRTEGGTGAAQGDSGWAFTPASAWRSGVYALRVDAALEDIAGNSIARVFDADRQDGAPAAEDAARAERWRRVEFRVR